MEDKYSVQEITDGVAVTREGENGPVETTDITIEDNDLKLTVSDMMGDIAIVTMPPEVFLQAAELIKKRLPAKPEEDTREPIEEVVDGCRINRDGLGYVFVLNEDGSRRVKLVSQSRDRNQVFLAVQLHSEDVNGLVVSRRSLERALSILPK